MTNDTLLRVFRRNIIIIIILIVSYSMIYGQKTKEEPPPLSERLFYGGNLGLQFGTITDIEISPVIGIWLLPRLAVAAGPDYRFYKDMLNRTNIFGGKIYSQLVIFQNINSFIPLSSNTGIFLHVENQLLSLESIFWKIPPVTTDRFYVNTLLGGGGISQQIGRRSSINFMVLWALNESEYDLYSKPEIRVSFIF